MRIHALGMVGGVLLMTGCSGGEQDYRAATEEAPENSFGFWEASEPGLFATGDNARFAAALAADEASQSSAEGLDSDSANPAPAQPTDGAQIAYSYSYGFRIAADRIEALQQSHAALCEKMGPNHCRVLRLARAGSDDDGFGQLDLRVAANEARGFGASLGETAEEAGGEQASFAIDGEDLTETIIDTESHLASRRLLRERLMEVLRTRQGTVGDLVEAERAVAEVNEDLDSAASNLAELSNRVRMSAVSIEYGPYIAEGSTGFARPISDALGSIGTTLGVTIAAIVYIAVALIPIVPFVMLLRWLWRRSGWRLRRERAKPAEE